jgi:hypothetical protein
VTAQPGGPEKQDDESGACLTSAFHKAVSPAEPWARPVNFPSVDVAEYSAPETEYVGETAAPATPGTRASAPMAVAAINPILSMSPPRCGSTIIARRPALHHRYTWA